MNEQTEREKGESNALDKEKLESWLNQKWVGPKICPICGKNNWAIGDRLMEMREFRWGAIMYQGQSFPVATVVCTECGNTILINAMVADLLKKDADRKMPAIIPVQEQR